MPSLAGASGRGGHIVCFGGEGAETLVGTFVAAWAQVISYANTYNL